MAVLKKNLERLSHCLGTVFFFAVTVLSNTTGLSHKGNDVMKPTRAELRMVNLETAIVVRSMEKPFLANREPATRLREPVVI